MIVTNPNFDSFRAKMLNVANGTFSNKVLAYFETLIVLQEDQSEAVFLTKGFHFIVDNGFTRPHMARLCGTTLCRV